MMSRNCSIRVSNRISISPAGLPSKQVPQGITKSHMDGPRDRDSLPDLRDIKTVRRQSTPIKLQPVKIGGIKRIVKVKGNFRRQSPVINRHDLNQQVPESKFIAFFEGLVA